MLLDNLIPETTAPPGAVEEKSVIVGVR